MSLLISPAVIIAAYIRQEGLMSDPSDETTWPLYVSYMPDANNVKTDLGSIYDNSGKKDGRIMIGTVIQHYGIIFKIRSRDYSTGWAKMEAVMVNLDTIFAEPITVNSIDYIIQNVSRVKPFDSPGVEDGTKKRRMFESSLLVTLRRV